jgi:site-specific DNA-adenine methylase
MVKCRFAKRMPTSYTKGGFGREHQIQLASVFRKLSDRGCIVLLSNSDTPFIRELYSDFTITVVDDVRRSINSNTSKRNGHKELLISNPELWKPIVSVEKFFMDDVPLSGHSLSVLPCNWY